MSKYTVKLSDNELRLIRYWREACHNYNRFCPLGCLKEGTDFCHSTTDRITNQTKEQIQAKEQKQSENP